MTLELYMVGQMSYLECWVMQLISTLFTIEDTQRRTDREEYIRTRFAYESHILKAKIPGSRPVNASPVDKPPK